MYVYSRSHLGITRSAYRRWQAASRHGTMTRRDDESVDARDTRECMKVREETEVQSPRVTSGFASRRVTSRRVAFSVSRAVYFRYVLAHRTWRVATSHCAPGERGAATPSPPFPFQATRPPSCNPLSGGDDAPPLPPAARTIACLPPRGCGASAYSHMTDPARPCSIYLPAGTGEG